MSVSLSQIREYLPFDEVDVVLHHGRCCDGFGGAWAVWMATSKDDIIIYGCSHLAKKDEIDKIIDMCRDKCVLMIDFTFKSTVLKEINRVSSKFIILDHHVTSFDEVKAAELNHHSVLDVEHSGCWLGWKYCYPDEELPEFLQYIQDRDLWRHELPNTKAFVASFYPTVDYDLDEWLKLRNDDIVKKHIANGEIILKHQNLEIENMAKHATYIHNWRGYNIRAINATTLISDLGNYLSHTCDFALIWWYDAEKDIIKVSLRSDSEGNNVNVAQIALEFGGGGHANAAGFSWTKTIQELLYPLASDANVNENSVNEISVNENTNINENNEISVNENNESVNENNPNTNANTTECIIYDESMPLLIDESNILKQNQELKIWRRYKIISAIAVVAAAAIGFTIGFFVPK